MQLELKRFLKEIKDEEYDAVIIESAENIKYLVGYNIDSGILVIIKKHCYLFLDERYIRDIDKKLGDIELVLLINLKRQLKDILKKEKVKTVALETNYITIEKYKAYMSMLNKITINISANISKKLLEQRASKNEEDIEKIRIAQELTDEAFTHMLNYIKPGMTEISIAAELEKYLISLGSEGKPFDFIVVTGQRTSIPHGKPTINQVKRGDFITLDFGATIQGYHSDMTRTIAIGPITSKQKEIYEIVLYTQNKAISALKVGIQADKVDKNARNYLNKKGYSQYFCHGLGHGVGLQVHEYPTLTPKSEDIILENNVVTIEPGIYIPEEFGVRIEDMLVVKESGCINLTKSRKDLILI